MKRYSGRLIFIISHFTILILAVMVFVGISYRIRNYVTNEMADKQALVMKQAMNATDQEIEKVIKKAIDISRDEYVQWFYYIEEPFTPDELFYSVKLVDRLRGFYSNDPLIEDYYVYFGKSGRIANANSFYKKQQFYDLVWSYKEMTKEQWEDRILNETESGVFVGGQMMKQDSTEKELLTYIYQMQKAKDHGLGQVVLLLDAKQIVSQLKVGIRHGAVKITDSQGRHILYCQTDDEIDADLPAYEREGWKIINSHGSKLLVNSVHSEKTGWVYTSYLPMKYVTENADWINRLIVTGVLLLMILGTPLCYYWARKSYMPIQKMLRIFSESGYRRDEKGKSDMDYLEQSLCLVLDKHKDLEAVYQKALDDYNCLEENLQNKSVWKSYRQGSVKFSAQEKHKLINLIKTRDKQGWNRVLNEIYTKNDCENLSSAEVHRLYLFVVDMVLITMDDDGVDISRSFEGQAGLIDHLLKSSGWDELINAMDKIFEHIGYLLNENKLDTKERVAEKAIDYMKTHYSDNNFGLGVMADALGISQEHLSRVIKGVTGKTYMEILNGIRIEHAKIYLKTTDMKLDEIAEQVGWGNARNFIRIFKQYEGITPGKYR